MLSPEKEVQSRTKVVRPLVLDHVTPIPPSHFNVGKCPVFRQKNHLIINIVDGGGENLLRVPTFLSGIVGLFHIMACALLFQDNIRIRLGS